MSAVPAKTLFSVIKLGAVVGLGTVLGLSACGSDDSPTPDAASADTNIKSAFVVIGDQNKATARVVTSFAQCPQIVIDGATTRMDLRVAAGTPALRTTVSAAADSKASEFPVNVCETALPVTAAQVMVGTRKLPVPSASPKHILVLADTGCRLQKSSNVYQACTDPTSWPLPQIAKSAAAMAPDLIVHIGDYHYRENACPTDIAGCKDSPWGYGWDVWQADFLDPVAPLFSAAPWVMVRGNHEECARAGQGWFRLLDSAAYDATRTCDNPANDTTANYSVPYAVKLGTDTQFIVFDSAKIGTTALVPTDPVFQTYQSQFQKVAALTSNTGLNSVFINHHPILAFAPIKGAPPAVGNAALQSVLATANPESYLPAGVQTVLHGHVHDFQAIDFSSKSPGTIVSGNGGDNLDVNLPDPFPANLNPAPNAVLSSITHTSTFGFMTMDRQAGSSNWTYKAYSAAGKLLTTCAQTAMHLSCGQSGIRRAVISRRLALAIAAAIAVATTWASARAFAAPAEAPESVGKTPLTLNVPPAQQRFTRDASLAALGERLFGDKRLSEPQGTSCASCHESRRGFSGNHGSKTGVAAGSRPGLFAARNAPSLLYVRYTPPLFFYQDDDSNAPEPRGGLFADGRVDTIDRAVASPLLEANEMNNRTPANLAKKLLAAGYRHDLEQAFGEAATRDPEKMMASVGKAIEAYLVSDAMSPFSSRYDGYTKGEVQLTAQETRGLALFKDPDKGNCASCHVFSPTSTNPARSLFTDYGFDAIAAPRNRQIPMNRNPQRFDKGLCETAVAKQWPDPDQWCGYYKTPNLRNVAVRERFMHNGVFDSLRDVVAFYATRATDPNKWYKTGVKFDDLPAQLRGNVNINSTPYNRREGTPPAIDDAEIDAIVSFLGTLTDKPYLK